MTGADETPGIIFRWPRAYDMLLHLVWGRKEKQYRGRVLELAGLFRGANVLDVGCGTGTLAVAAKKLVGTEGRVTGIDASEEMVARARAKASKALLEIDFKQAAAQELPFADATFDAVLSTTVIHCLPAAQRTRCFREMARVLTPGGRLLIIDFGGSATSKHSLFGHLKAHRRFNLRDEHQRLADAGLTIIDLGSLGFADLHFILAVADSECAIEPLVAEERQSQSRHGGAYDDKSTESLNLRTPGIPFSSLKDAFSRRPFFLRP